mmetsp:Transcript_26076/g.52016  ORF Transcript_26076/g.52016 Transcript_26076/m.52016 type:complete len:209 (+) Transcript_26076:102-728(+)
MSFGSGTQSSSSLSALFWASSAPHFINLKPSPSIPPTASLTSAFVAATLPCIRPLGNSSSTYTRAPGTLALTASTTATTPRAASSGFMPAPRLFVPMRTTIAATGASGGSSSVARRYSRCWVWSPEMPLAKTTFPAQDSENASACPSQHGLFRESPVKNSVMLSPTNMTSTGGAPSANIFVLCSTRCLCVSCQPVSCSGDRALNSPRG